MFRYAFRPCRLLSFAGLLAVTHLAAAPASAQDDYEPDDASNAATPITPGEIQSGHSISPVADRDWVTFTVDRPSWVILRADDEGASFVEPTLTLYDASLQPIDTQSGVVEQVVPAGKYYGEIYEAFDTEVIEAYGVRLSAIDAGPDSYEGDNTRETAKPIALGERQIGRTIAPVGDQDWFTFTLNATTPLAIDALVSLGSVDITVFNSVLTQVATGTTRVLPNLNAGTYYIRVQESSGTRVTATYTLSLWRRDGPDPYEDDDTPEKATWLGNDGPMQTHTFHDAGDADWVRFHGEAGMFAGVMADPKGPDADPVFTLYRGDGVTLVALDPGTTNWNVDETGFYYLKFTNNPASRFGAGTTYSIGVNLFPVGITPGSLVGVVRSIGGGTVVANALVEITNFAGLKTRTDAKGFYFFPALPTGSYNVRVAAGGFGPAGPTSVKVGSGSTVKNFDLDPSQSVAGDVDGDGAVNAVDVQLTVNAVLGLGIGGLDADVNNDNSTNAVDIQVVIDTVLGV